MTIRAAFGNGIIAMGGYVATKAAALSASDITTPSVVEVVPKNNVYLFQMADPYLLVGFTVPNWLGVSHPYKVRKCAPILVK